MKIESYERNGLTVEIFADDSPESPREWGPNLGVMLCGHRNYNLGDEQIEDVNLMAECSACEGTGEAYGPVTEPVGGFEARPPDCPTCDGMGEIELTPIEWAKRERGARVVIPLGLIDHSGISMYAGGGEHWCDPGGWDSGTVGIIFDTPETLAECGCEKFTDEEIEKSLRSEIEVYDQYLTGDVYGYVIEDADGDTMGSLWGCYGHKYVEEEANRAADCAAKRVEREAAERAHWAARDVETDDTTVAMQYGG